MGKERRRSWPSNYAYLPNKDQQFDLVVIASGSAGKRDAICATKLRKCVTVIERTLMMRGACVHTGTIPSKSDREVIFQLTGIAVRTLFGSNYRTGRGEAVLPTRYESQSRQNQN